MSAVRITVLTTVHVPGDTRIFHKQVASLADAGYEVHYCAPEAGSLDPRDGIVLHDLGPRVQTPSARLARLRKAAGLVRNLAPTVVHIHDPELLPAMALSGAGRRAALVYDIHENIRQQLRIKPWIPSPLRPFVAWMYGLIERICLSSVRAVVLAEDSYADDYVGCDATVVRNYPVLDRIANEPRTAPMNARICYVGGVSVERGALEIIDAFRIAARSRDDLDLVLAGPITAPLTAEVLLDRLGDPALAARVRIPGRVPLDEAYALMAGSAVGVAPLRPVGNYVGSLPTKMFEYMSCGLPVVVSDFPLWRSIVDDAACGRCCSGGSAESLAEGILSVLEDPERYARMSDSGLAAVRDRYNWTHEAAKLLDLYRRITS